MTFRQGNNEDTEQMRVLALASWAQFQDGLSPENWQRLFTTLNSLTTYEELLKQAHCIVCESDMGELIGMAFLVNSGHPTDIYQADWSYLRFVSVHPDYACRGIGRQLTKMCIEMAKNNNEHTIALHTSEMMHRARHIYESLGFTILRELEPRLGKRYWLYTLTLPG